VTFGYLVFSCSNQITVIWLQHLYRTLAVFVVLIHMQIVCQSVGTVPRLKDTIIRNSHVLFFATQYFRSCNKIMDLFFKLCTCVI